jgi:hypothetical protein
MKRFSPGPLPPTARRPSPEHGRRVDAYHTSLPRRLPVVPRALEDELLSSWLDRTARFYLVRTSDLLTHMGISIRSAAHLDHELSLAQAIVMAGFVDHAPDMLLGMTHVGLPHDCRPLVQFRKPRHLCRGCDGARTGVVLKSWMQAWRITCRTCGALLVDDGAPDQAEDAQTRRSLVDDASEGEQLVDRYAAGATSFLLSPTTMFALMVHRRVMRAGEPPMESAIACRVVSLFVDDPDELVGVHRLSGIVGRARIYPTATRTVLLAGLARAMRSPLEAIERLRAHKVLRLNDLLERDPLWGPRRQLRHLT